MAPRRTKDDLAAEVWRSFLDFFFSQRDGHMRALHDLGLSPGDMKTLMTLEPGQPRPMGQLADVLVCDASNVTWLVDRLEQRGLVERRPHPTDRRVKTVVLTARGEHTKAELMARMYEPPPAFLGLSRPDLEALAPVLEKLNEARSPLGLAPSTVG